MSIFINLYFYKSLSFKNHQCYFCVLPYDVLRKMIYGVWFMYIIFLITVEQTIRYVGSLSKGTARSTQCTDVRLRFLGPPMSRPRKSNTTSYRICYLLANTEECCKLQQCCKLQHVVATVKSVKNNFYNQSR